MMQHPVRAHMDAFAYLDRVANRHWYRGGHYEGRDVETRRYQGGTLVEVIPVGPDPIRWVWTDEEAMRLYASFRSAALRHRENAKVLALEGFLCSVSRP